MSTRPATRAAVGSVLRWFWGLAVVAVLLAGALSVELSAVPSPGIGLAVAVTGSALALVITQISRLMRALSQRQGRPMT